MLDMMLAMASFAFVFLYVTFNLRSLFLAMCGMFEIVISLPLAFFVWKNLLQQTRISWLQVCKTLCSSSALLLRSPPPPHHHHLFLLLLLLTSSPPPPLTHPIQPCPTPLPS